MGSPVYPVIAAAAAATAFRMDRVAAFWATSLCLEKNTLSPRSW